MQENSTQIQNQNTDVRDSNNIENYPIETKNNKSSKLIYILIFIILVLIGVIAFGFLKYQSIQSELNNQTFIENSVDLQPIEQVETKTTNETDTLITYTDPNNTYSFQYPKEFELGTYFSTESPALNNRIVWSMNDYKMSECQGGCPVIELQKELEINNYNVTMYEGYVGEIGGNIPQSFINYEIKSPKTDKYFSIYLWELEQTTEVLSKESSDREIGQISQKDKADLLEIVNTFKFW